MNNDQTEKGSTLIGAATNSISTTNLKSLETASTPVSNKTAEVNQNSVANCNNSFSTGIADSASDVPVTLSTCGKEKNEQLVNDKAPVGVLDNQIENKQSVDASDNPPSEDVVVEKSVTDGSKTGDPLLNSLENSLKDDSVLSESESSRLGQCEITLDSSLVSESVKDSNGEGVVEKSTAKSDSLLAEMRQICNKTNENEEAMDVDDSLTISNDESKSESKVEGKSNNPSVSVRKGNDEKTVDSVSKNSLKDQDDSNLMLGLDESSTNMSENSSKFVVHDCDQDLSQDDLQEVASVDPLAQAGDSFKGCGVESMEVDEDVEEAQKKDLDESGEKKDGDKGEDEKKDDGEGEKDDDEGGGDKKDDEKGGEEKKDGENVVKKDGDSCGKKKDGVETEGKEIGDKTVEKNVDKESTDECMEVDGKQVKSVGEKKVEENKKNEDEKEEGDKHSSNKVVDDKSDDCVLVEDGKEGKDSCSGEEKKDDEKQKKVVEASKNKSDKDVEASEKESDKDVEASEKESDKDVESSKVTPSGDKPSSAAVEEDKSKKVTDKDASNDESKKEADKDASKDKGGEVAVAEIEIDEDICIIPDTVRLPPVPGGSGQVSSTTPTAVASASKALASGSKDVLNEVSSTTNRISVVKMESVTEVKQEKSVAVSSRPKRQSATRADAKIKATVKEMEQHMEYEGEKENEEDVEDNIQLCKQCGIVKPCKFNILNRNKVVSHLCSEACAHLYRNTLLEADRARAAAAAGLLTGGAVGATRGGNVHINDAGEFARSCSQCRSQVIPGDNMLSWETMDFCNEDCLGKYQNCLGSHCAYCKSAVQQTSLGKYCVRFGYHIRQFCSSNCLEEYKRGLKVCSFCQKDISSSETGFLAPVGDKGTFKDFCTQSCMEQYDRLSNNQPPPAEMHACDVCNENKLVAVQVLVDSKLNKLCSEVCFAAFKFVNEVTVDRCDMCQKYFDRNTLRSDNLTVYYDDAQYNFCCKTCMNAYILGKRKIVPCNWCKVKKYNFDMIKRVLETGQTLMMCSLNCLTLYKVSINAVSSRRIKCDSCGSVSQAQYHLTMSDATIRNFCTYPCVMNFQAQYNKNPITLPGGQPQPIITGGPKRAILPASAKDTRASSSVPVISSVTSLAPSTNGQPPTSLLQTSAVNSLSPVVSSVTSNAVTSAKSPMVSGVGGAGSTATAIATSCNNYVIVREKNPPKMANKCTSFRPTSHTKGVSCRPHASTQATQTDVSGGDGKTVIIPIPVPVYIPVPMHMYTMPVPTPIPFPVPIPVPVFIPTTRGSAQGIMKEIKRIHAKTPTDPLEAELLMMAEMVAEDKDNDAAGSASGSGRGSPAVAAPPSDGGASPDRQSDSPAEDVASLTSKFADGSDDDMAASILPVSCELATANDNDEGDLDAELTPSTITAPAPPMARHFLDTSVADSDENVDDPDPVEQTSSKRKRGRPPSLRGGGSGNTSKRGRRSTSSSSNHITYTPPHAAISTTPALKFMLGVNAYKQWVLAKNAEFKKAEDADASNSSPKRSKQLKSDLLQQTPEELNYSLSRFVQEVHKPSGDAYPPDTIYYFCLGIQHYLFDNGRIENIFTDAYFETFTDALHTVMLTFSSAIHDAQVIVTRVEEEHLWESKQLGAHSPHVLLCTLMFFNTKYFNLVSVDDHMKLSFSHIMKHWKNNPGSNIAVTGTRNVLLRFYPPAASGDVTGKRSTKSCYEQYENEDDPLRCPVKLYEFYLSKCPESVKSKADLFYLQPERSCVPDSPVWYSTQPLSEEGLSKVLNRIKLVKEINIALLNA